MKRFLIVLLVLVLCFSTGVVVASADSVTLEWSANSEPDLVGYRVFIRDWKGVYNYTTPAWEGIETTCIIDIGSLKLPHFVARAYDIEGFESENSNEVYDSNGPPASPGSLAIIPQGN